MIPGLQELAELLARRFAQYLRAPLASASPFTTGGPPILVRRKSGVSGVAIGQINGLPLQGQTWTVAISTPYEIETPTAAPAKIANVRPWIFARISWAIGMAKHTAEVDLPAGGVALTLPFDVLDVSIVNASPDGTLDADEVDPRYQLAVATAFAGRTTAHATRTITGVTPTTIVPPAFSSVVQISFRNPKPINSLDVSFLDYAGNLLGSTNLSAVAPIQRPTQMLIPHGTAYMQLDGNPIDPAQFTAIFTLSI